MLLPRLLRPPPAATLTQCSSAALVLDGANAPFTSGLQRVVGGGMISRTARGGIISSTARANVIGGNKATLGSKDWVRYATHQAQGRANGAKQGPGKRLGAKKSGGEYVIPGNIIFRQRGTAWFPGENCKFGRDHCVFATQAGWVRYYRDPHRHPKRQYIGVALEKHDVLPYPVHAPRRRRLGMVAVIRTDVAESLLAGSGSASSSSNSSSSSSSSSTPKTTKTGSKSKTLRTGRNYVVREPNWEIGQAAERADEKEKVSFKPYIRKRVRFRNDLKRQWAVKANRYSTKVMRERGFRTHTKGKRRLARMRKRAKLEGRKIVKPTRSVKWGKKEAGAQGAAATGAAAKAKGSAKPKTKAKVAA